MTERREDVGAIAQTLAAAPSRDRALELLLSHAEERSIASYVALTRAIQLINALDEAGAVVPFDARRVPDAAHAVTSVETARRWYPLHGHPRGGDRRWIERASS